MNKEAAYQLGSMAASELIKEGNIFNLMKNVGSAVAPAAKSLFQNTRQGLRQMGHGIQGMSRPGTLGKVHSPGGKVRDLMNPAVAKGQQRFSEGFRRAAPGLGIAAGTGYALTR